MITADEITQEKWALHSTSEMGRQEAQEITKAIQQNFDSLGMMLKSANERKAWKALGYVNFASYCENEFGKSKSRAYQIIEEAEIAQLLRDSAPADLKIPANSQLRILKNLSLDQQIQAIKCAEDLASTTQNKKPTNLQMRLAVEKTANKPEQFKHSLSELGFSKGAEVIVVRGVDTTGSRGFIRKLDKKGQLWVELHTRNSSLIPYDVTQLRILQPSEKPSKATYFGTTEIGDKVLIFSRNFENTIGEIAVRINEKMVGVRLENNRIVELPYAELEPIETESYEQEESSDTLSSEQLITSIQSQLITCGTEKTKLATDIIIRVWRMLESEDKKVIKKLIFPETERDLRDYKQANDDLLKINSELREDLLRCHRQTAELQTRLDEAEQTIGQMVTAITLDTRLDTATPPLAPEQIPDFLVESTDSWREILQANHFIPVAFNLDGMFKGNWRGWDYFFHSPNGGVVAIDLANNKKEMFTRCTEHNFDIDLGDEEEIRKWLKNIINQVEDFCPGQLSLNFDTALDTALDTELKREMAQQRENIEGQIEVLGKQREATTGKALNKLNKQIYRLYDQLSILDTFETVKIGQTVAKKRFPETVGTVTSLSFSIGGMPQVMVHWTDRDSTDSNSVEILDFAPDIQETEQR